MIITIIEKPLKIKNNANFWDFWADDFSGKLWVVIQIRQKVEERYC